MVKLNYAQFEKRCEETGVEPRAFSKGEYEALKPTEKRITDALPTASIERGNKGMFERMCRDAGLDPATTVTSPALRKLIEDQNKARSEIGDPEK